ncbi:3443_t:CDS:2, partial [Scutellospora calospora]
FCPTCNRSYPMNSSWWCNDCDRKQLMEGWTSGNSEYDKIIKDTQHEVTGFNDPCLRWIPPYLIKDWVKIAKGGYGTVHSAKWIGAKFKELEMHIITHMVTPVFEELKVAIKTFDSEQDFRNELKAAASPFQLYVSQIRPIGISRVEATGKYCLVMNYAENRDLLYYLQKNPNPSVDTKIKILVYLVNYLKALHVQNLIHRNIHSGNVLIGSQIACDGTRFLTCALTDYGLSINKDNVNCLGKVSGVLPYIAPEVIRGKPYTQAADIYAFGILMWLLECCDLPFNDRPHDNTLASAICQGLRPELPTWTSDCYSKLYKCCVDADFSKRPSAYEIFEIISKWEKDPKCMHALNIAYKSQKKNFLKRNKKIHPGAIYTSRTFNFENLMTKINPKSILSSRENLLPSVEEIRKWDTPDTLINFLKNPKLCLNLKEDHFKFFHSQEIDGPAFLLLTEEVLISDGLKRGPAVKIANLIKEILEGEGRSKNAQ